MSEYKLALIIYVTFCETACILCTLDEHFSLRKLRQLLCLGFLPSLVRQQSF